MLWGSVCSWGPSKSNVNSGCHSSWKALVSVLLSNWLELKWKIRLSTGAQCYFSSPTCAFRRSVKGSFFLLHSPAFLKKWHQVVDRRWFSTFLGPDSPLPLSSWFAFFLSFCRTWLDVCLELVPFLWPLVPKNKKERDETTNFKWVIYEWR